MAVARGSCGQCKAPLLVLKWIGNKRKLIVMCNDCNEEMHYDLDAMVEALGDPDWLELPWDGKVH